MSFGDRGDVAVDDLSLDVRAGEIVGIAGVQGNGQDELVECVAGLRRPASGSVSIDGTRGADSPLKARQAGLAYIPADRGGGVGLSLMSPIWENLVVGHVADVRVGPFLSSRAAKSRAEVLVKDFDIRGGGIDASAGSLSGGQSAESANRPGADPGGQARRGGTAFARGRHRSHRVDP